MKIKQEESEKYIEIDISNWKLSVAGENKIKE
jgi:hypothetical protein